MIWTVRFIQKCVHYNILIIVGPGRRSLNRLRLSSKFVRLNLKILKTQRILMFVSPPFHLQEKFQLSIYGKLGIYEQLRFWLKFKIFHDPGAWSLPLMQHYIFSGCFCRHGFRSSPKTVTLSPITERLAVELSLPLFKIYM